MKDLALTDAMLSTLCYVAEYGGIIDGDGHPVLRIHNGNPAAGAVTTDAFGTCAWIRFTTAKALERRGLIELEHEHPRRASVTEAGRVLAGSLLSDISAGLSLARQAATQDAARRQDRIEAALR